MTNEEKSGGGNGIDCEASSPEEVSKWRRAAPQVIASTVKNLLLMDLGMTIAFSTIVIPVLLDDKDSKHLRFDENSASWFGSIMYMCQPLGSVVSGLVMEPFGRKYAMMIVNVPHIIAWGLMYYAESVEALYIAAIIMGLGIGFMEAPIITYIGEICEPKLRGTMTSYSNLFATFGMALIFFLGNVADWRTTALISMFLPILTIIALTQIPETPVWLMAHGKEKEATESLQWLRGWVSAKAVEKEFNELKRYSDEAHKKTRLRGYDNPAADIDKCHISTITNEKTPQREISEFRKPTTIEVMQQAAKDFFRPAVFKPLIFILIFFTISHWTGVSSTRPFLIKVIEEFKFPIEPYRATMIFGSIAFAGSVACTATIAVFRKRPIALVSVLACSISAISLCIIPQDILGGWISFLMFVTLYFFSMYGAAGIVWTILSEVFPYRGRSQASGVAAAFSYLIIFSSTKSFVHLKNSLGLHNVFGLYGLISGFGFVYLYYALPETEGKTLEEIEHNYKSKRKQEAANAIRSALQVETNS